MAVGDLDWLASFYPDDVALVRQLRAEAENHHEGSTLEIMLRVAADRIEDMLTILDNLPDNRD
jgi:hypothetical protein